MKYRIIYFFAAMQDWPSQYGDEKLCGTAKYPEKRDVIKAIVHAMGIRPDSAEEKKLYKELYKELKYEILYDLSDPGEKITDEEYVYESLDFGYYEKGSDEIQYVPEGNITKKEYRACARYFIRISSDSEELLETVSDALMYPYGVMRLGVSCCAGSVVVIKEEELDNLMEAINNHYV